MQSDCNPNTHFQKFGEKRLRLADLSYGFVRCFPIVDEGDVCVDNRLLGELGDGEKEGD